MLLIGENLNVISRVIGKAFKEKDPGPIAEEAKRQKEKGMDWIDVNLGPARKGGPELMEFVVKTIQEEIGDTPPLCLDTSNIEAMEAGLAIHKGKAIINSIMCRPERYEKMIPLAVKYQASMIALMWGPEGLPRDENERGALAAELIYAANEAGVPNEDIFVDHLRPILNQTYLVMLERKGLYSCIADAYDDQLIAIARGERSDVVDSIHKVMDEEEIDVGSLSKEIQDYVKTARVILGQSLYSDSWLEL
jgi:5-methyltetrahydrofolate corrinoid/iron sulfur protein methyltransferase